MKKYKLYSFKYKRKVFLQFWINSRFPFLHFSKYIKPSELELDVLKNRFKIEKLEKQVQELKNGS